MYDDPHRESPLAQLLVTESTSVPAAAIGLQISERPFMGHINLRGDPSNQAFIDTVEDLLAVELPTDPNTVADGPNVTVLWLGPNEWLLLTLPDEQYETVRALKNSLGHLFTAVTDVSGGQTIINIQGVHAKDVLAKSCTLDLHQSIFSPGQCAQTNMGKVVAIIRQLDQSPSYDIIVRRSFADHLARWLKDAAQEYGISFTDCQAT